MTGPVGNVRTNPAFQCHSDISNDNYGVSANSGTKGNFLIATGTDPGSNSNGSSTILDLKRDL